MPPADLASHSKKPTFLRPAAIGTSVANQVKTFHADLFARKSCHVMILVKIIKIITIKAVVVGFTLNVEAPIHNTSANTEIKAMKISLRVMEPNFLYSSLAHAAISGEPFTSGLQNT